jgi:EAL domain-containing protein (putative c-di-GMP-specific phosphodiesterase class I)
MNSPYITDNNLIQKILSNKAVEIHLQPIVSIRTKSIFAYESLTRCRFEGKMIPPQILFELANKANLSSQLDEMTRQLAIKKFHTYYKKNNKELLFLNVEADIINNFEKEKLGFIDLITKLNIPFKNFILEIKEDEIENIEALEKFCKYFKGLGFGIALDDFGTGNSNFYRLNVISPDIIKIDKSLFTATSKRIINKEIVKSISKMSQNLGIKVLAEGVEDFNSISMAMKAGINLFQGYYFSKPKDSFNHEEFLEIITLINKTGNEFKDKVLNSIKKKRDTIGKFDQIAIDMINGNKSIEEIHQYLNRNFKYYNEIEAIYIIDVLSSKQIKDTILDESISGMYNITSDGDEHYLKEYFYITMETKKGIYLSNRYVSFATGNVCKTFAKKFDLNGVSYILCLDIIIEKN